MSQSIDAATRAKIEFSGACTHQALAELVDEYELPKIYGGLCNCKATCVYSEKGPWSEVENRVNYQKPEEASDSDEELKEYEMSKKMGRMSLDNVFRDVSTDYLNVQDEENIGLLKNQLMMQMPGAALN